MTVGVPQRSVLGPLLWNMRLHDVTTIVTVANMVREREEKTNKANRNVGAWLNEAGLTLASHKRKAIFISGRKTVEKMEVIVGSTRIESKRAIKYLEVVAVV